MLCFAGVNGNALVRVRLLAFVCRLWGLVRPLRAGAFAAQASGDNDLTRGKVSGMQLHGAASGAILR